MAAVAGSQSKPDSNSQVPKSAVLHRKLGIEFLRVAKAKGQYLILDDGRKILDASGGAAVTCLGHCDDRVNQAMIKQLNEVAYCATIFYTTTPFEELCQVLIDSTNGHMARAYIVNSGSEAMEAAMKMARQYFLEKKPAEPQRTKFISRAQSYHGITLGSLSMGGHKYRREKFEPMLLSNITQVSPCYAYREKKQDETDAMYVERLAAELDAEFQRLGPETVCGFVAEPVVGAALGSVPAVAGYFKAMQAVCRKYGALLIMDEVMSGMGRTGTLHAWEQEGVKPDIQTIGKGLGGGYQAIAGVLMSQGVIDVLEQGTGVFVHGHTYQGHAVGCAAALEVQRIIKEDKLLENVRKMGDHLSRGLRERVGGHPNVGDIRGKGLFWSLELVADKASKAPFPITDGVAMDICTLGLTAEYGVSLYPGTGGVDGVNGDHIMLAPAYIITEAEVAALVDMVGRLVDDYFRAKAASS
ncbi:aminotransferase [Gaeumannomyces tritici R3-111a-1]|uniref:Aminotransferase n=1 Tax=Gaeumannomyces tritici (strain R3-111a-1) TaxID=644352 RepID=J3NNQ3_GAET3|nr:aminotransferase [Gaeumannomyces tritici R3-111a-1]EJT77805.1 aminotransferase [Gaeumannomyces tritici R3-111a-1]